MRWQSFTRDRETPRRVQTDEAKSNRGGVWAKDAIKQSLVDLCDAVDMSTLGYAEGVGWVQRLRLSMSNDAGLKRSRRWPSPSSASPSSALLHEAQTLLPSTDPPRISAPTTSSGEDMASRGGSGMGALEPVAKPDFSFVLEEGLGSRGQSRQQNTNKTELFQNSV